MMSEGNDLMKKLEHLNYDHKQKVINDFETVLGQKLPATPEEEEEFPLGNLLKKAIDSTTQTDTIIAKMK